MEIVWSGWAGFFLFLWISTSVCRLAPLFFFSCIETYLQDQSTKGGRDWGGRRGNGRRGGGGEGGRGDGNWVLAHSVFKLTHPVNGDAPLPPLTQFVASAYLNPSKKSCAFKMLITEVSAAGTMIMGVLDLWSANSKTDLRPFIDNSCAPLQRQCICMQYLVTFISRLLASWFKCMYWHSLPIEDAR